MAWRPRIGDRVTFRSIARWSAKAQTRVVKAVEPDGHVQVRYGGWGDFRVRPDEIVAIKRSEREGGR